MCMGGSEVLRYLDLELDVEVRACTCAGQPVRLTPREFDILRVLMQNQGRTMRTQDICDEVWGPSRPGGGHSSLAVHIRSLRSKLGDSFDEPRYIRTLWGCGYCVG